MYTEPTTVFSGSEQEGYLVFPALDDDVTKIQLDLEGIAVRFDFSGAAVETIDLSFSFERDVLRGYNLSDALQADAATHRPSCPGPSAFKPKSDSLVVRDCEFVVCGMDQRRPSPGRCLPGRSRWCFVDRRGRGADGGCR